MLERVSDGIPFWLQSKEQASQNFYDYCCKMNI